MSLSLTWRPQTYARPFPFLKNLYKHVQVRLVDIVSVDEHDLKASDICEIHSRLIFLEKLGKHVPCVFENMTYPLVGG